jgi:hypothetical protein
LNGVISPIVVNNQAYKQNKVTNLNNENEYFLNEQDSVSLSSLNRSVNNSTIQSINSLNYNHVNTNLQNLDNQKLI